MKLTGEKLEFVRHMADPKTPGRFSTQTYTWALRSGLVAYRNKEFVLTEKGRRTATENGVRFDGDSGGIA